MRASRRAGAPQPAVDPGEVSHHRSRRDRQGAGRRSREPADTRSRPSRSSIRSRSRSRSARSSTCASPTRSAKQQAKRPGDGRAGGASADPRRRLHVSRARALPRGRPRGGRPTTGTINVQARVPEREQSAPARAIREGPRRHGPAQGCAPRAAARRARSPGHAARSRWSAPTTRSRFKTVKLGPAHGSDVGRGERAQPRASAWSSQGLQKIRDGMVVKPDDGRGAPPRGPRRRSDRDRKVTPCPASSSTARSWRS